MFVQIKGNKSAASARAFLKALHKACPIRINKVLTDNGKAFTDRLLTSWTKEPSGQHEFDRLCHALGIEHRLTKPRTPQSNGMAERFNGCISDVLKTHRFDSGKDMCQTIERYVYLSCRSRRCIRECRCKNSSVGTMKNLSCFRDSQESLIARDATTSNN